MTNTIHEACTHQLPESAFPHVMHQHVCMQEIMHYSSIVISKTNGKVCVICRELSQATYYAAKQKGVHPLLIFIKTSVSS